MRLTRSRRSALATLFVAALGVGTLTGAVRSRVEDEYSAQSYLAVAPQSVRPTVVREILSDAGIDSIDVPDALFAVVPKRSELKRVELATSPLGSRSTRPAEVADSADAIVFSDPLARTVRFTAYGRTPTAARSQVQSSAREWLRRRVARIGRFLGSVTAELELRRSLSGRRSRRDALQGAIETVRALRAAEVTRLGIASKPHVDDSPHMARPVKEAGLAALAVVMLGLALRRPWP